MRHGREDTAASSIAQLVIIGAFVQMLKMLKQHYQERINELSRYCEEEDVKINDTSTQGFWDFLEELKSPETLGLVTTHTGNLRAVWETDESYFAVEFFGDNGCECVMWSPVTKPASKYCTITESIVGFCAIRNE